MLSKREAIDDTAEIGGSDTKISINDTKIGTNSTNDNALDQGDKEEEITIGNKTSATQTSNQEPDLKETLVKINMEHDRPAKMEQHRLDSITLDRRMSENLSNHPQGGNNQTNVTWSGSNPS